MTTFPTPHDSLFRKFFGDIGIARDFLQIHLPVELRSQCDFTTLAITSGAFVEDNLRTQCSDILYSLQTASGQGYIYCLIEHQSRPDKLMAFRLMRYAIAAMQRHLEQGNDRLPLVIPLLFYHGEVAPYPYSTCWLDCFDDKQQAEALYRRAFPLVDVTVIPDEEFKTHPRVGLLEYVQKHIRERDLNLRIHDIALLLEMAQLPKTLVVALLCYLAQEGNSLDSRTFIRNLAVEAPRYQEEMMTIADQLKQEGLQKGLQQGRSEEKQQIARNLLAMGLDRKMVESATGMKEQELETLSA